MQSCKDSSNNRKVIAKYIHQKLQAERGYLTPSSYLKPVQTDMDSFPYDRFFRGMADCSHPRVFDREAGHRKWNPQAYAYQYSPELITPRKFEGCFQIPCSTILPCVNFEMAYKQPIEYCVNISP